MRKINILLIISLVLFINGCMPEDDAVSPFNRGNVTNGTVAMGISYNKQIYFSLDENKIIKENNVLDWDLGFSCSNENMEIILNFGKFMTAANLGEVDFDAVNSQTAKDLPTEKWNYDNPFGKLDSTAIGSWWDYSNNQLVSLNYVYLVDRGIDSMGRPLGIVKFQVTDFKDDMYLVKFSDLKKPNTIEISVKKDSAYNYVHLSFNNGGKVNTFEPEKEKWDLLFSKYTELLYTDVGDAMWYSVVSVLTNNKFVKVATVKTDDFANLTELILSDPSKVIKPYSNYKNAIGHEWKYFILEGSKWVIYSNVAYLIKSTSGFTYKLHFTAFEDLGVKGHPKFEFQKL